MPLEDGWIYAGDSWNFYWKPLRKQDISDRREQEKRLKNDEKWRKIGTLQG